MKGGSLTEGLTKKEKFSPAAQSPGQTSKGMRPKHDNPKVKRKAHVVKG